MIKRILVALLVVTVRCADDYEDNSGEDLRRCVKSAKKFTMTRVCRQLDLAVQCLSIETPYATEVLDYCYKELNLDPINLKNSLQYVCYAEDAMEEAAECLCRAAYEIEYEDAVEEIEHHINEQHEGIHSLAGSYNTSMMHCMEYMDQIYHKMKFF